jgi:hypothetical protein
MTASAELACDAEGATQNYKRCLFMQDQICTIPPIPDKQSFMNRCCKIGIVTAPPEPIDRTTVGVGESISVLFPIPRLPQYEVKGSGRVTWSERTNYGPDPGYEYVAGDHAGTDQISAKIPDSSCHPTVTINVIEPTGVKYEVVQKLHVWKVPNIGMVLKYYIQPTNVSFSGIQFREVNVPATGTGAFFAATGTGHIVNGKPYGEIENVGAFVPDKGSQVQSLDIAYCCRGISDAIPTKLENGLYWVDIPLQYRVGDGEFHTFATASQTASLSDVDGQSGALRINKHVTTNGFTGSDSGAEVDGKVDDETSWPPPGRIDQLFFRFGFGGFSPYGTR